MLNKTMTGDKIVAEVIDLKSMPAEVKLILLLREEVLPARILHEFAIWCAETALTKANITNKVCWNALRIKRLWLDDKATDEELSIAKRDVSKIARSAPMIATINVVWYAIGAIAEYAARQAAWAGTSDDVMANYVARAAVKEKQLAKLKEMLMLMDNIKEKEKNE